jgi:uncharacterized protein
MIFYFLLTLLLPRIVTQAVKHVPSSFNSQTSRAVIFFGENHKKVWKIISDITIPTLPEEQKEYMKSRFDAFSGAYGSVAFFEDDAAVEEFQNKVPM